MSEAPQLTIRPVNDADRARACLWWREPGPFNPAVLPPIGVACDDANGPAGLLWVHLSASHGVGFLEHLIMRPGLRMTQAAAIGNALTSGAEAAAKALGYGLLVAYALPACARFLRKFGWETGDERPKIAMVKTI
jgi:hypothetical protein